MFEIEKRNPAAILSAVLDNDKDSTWVAKSDIKIIFPKRYINNKLGFIDSRFNVLGFFCLILPNGDFTVANICGILPLTPEESTVIKMNGVDYYELSWSKGAIICPDQNVVLKSTLAFEIYDEFIAKTRIPPYMDSVDHSKLFDTLQDFTGVNLGADNAILKVYNATTTRSVKDRTVHARLDYKTQADFAIAPVDRIPLRNVAYGADNTTARLLGSYASQGFNSSLVNPSETTEDVEVVLLS